MFYHKLKKPFSVEFETLFLFFIHYIVINSIPFFHQEADMSLNFEEQILEATKAIAAATAALVKSASEAQKELVAQGKVSYKTQTPCFK